jgi:NADH:ubiquinone reductase (non-electrogenic)
MALAARLSLRRVAQRGTRGFCVISPQPKSARTHAIDPDAPKREKLVILGCGWGGMALLTNLDKRALQKYDVLVVSISNYFLYTPLLPSLAVGTVEPRSIIDPVRPVINNKLLGRYSDANVNFLEAEVTKIDPEKRVLTANDQGPTRTSSFEIAYDKLVVGLGATTNTFGTPGADQYCRFLKSIGDGLAIRAQLVDLLETACIPGLSEERRRQLLTICVVGGGPTGIESAAEIRDFLAEDLADKYPVLKDIGVRVVVIEMATSVLNMFDRAIQTYTRDHFTKLGIDLKLNTRVKAVHKESIEIVDVQTNKVEEMVFGMCIWASGVRPVDVTLQLAKDLQQQRMLAVDANMRALGAEGTIFAIGDNCRIDQKLFKDRGKELFDEGDKNGDGSLSVEELHGLAASMKTEFPVIRDFVERLETQAEARQSKLTKEEFLEKLEATANAIRPLPPTAQVANQQGEYVAKILNELEPEQLAHKGGFSPNFEYHHQGALAYVGEDSAVMSDSDIFPNLKGWFVLWIWRGVYFSKTVSIRSKALMAFDWGKAKVFGRDVSRL